MENLKIESRQQMAVILNLSIVYWHDKLIAAIKSGNKSEIGYYIVAYQCRLVWAKNRPTIRIYKPLP